MVSKYCDHACNGKTYMRRALQWPKRKVVKQTEAQVLETSQKPSYRTTGANGKFGMQKNVWLRTLGYYFARQGGFRCS